MDEETKNIYRDCYNFHKKYFDIPQADTTMWETAIAEAEHIRKKYKNVFCRFLLGVIIDDIERRSLNNGKDGNVRERY
jgi:hypothetical protein